MLTTPLWPCPRNGKVREGIRMGGSPLNAVRCQPDVPTPSLHKAETSDMFTHATWADDIILMASPRTNLGR